MPTKWETGKIVKFDQERGYGFIEPDDGKEDLFVHTNDLSFEKFHARPGLAVRFQVEESERGGQKACDVELADRPAPANGAVAGQDLGAEITEILLANVPTLTGGQIVEVRRQIVALAGRRGWK